MATQEPASSSDAEPLAGCGADESPQRFPVVGIGASAGGFDALSRLLGAVPENPNVAFVIIQHLPRDKESLAAEVISRFTRLPVIEVHDETVVAPNHLYVIPPGKFLQIDHGRLSLRDMTGPRGVPVAVDFFFRSLANDQRQCAVGVILSGTGSDGTLGVKALKSAGGLVIAQDPPSAEHSGMPQSAIDSGAVDQILVPEKIAEAILRFASHPYVREALPADDDEVAEDAQWQGASDGLEAVLALLKSECNRDFRHYKVNTLMRRTRRRMCLHRMESFSEYLAYLERNAAEREALSKDLLISVTDFFRDPEAWAELAAIAIAPLVAAKTNDQEIRVWVVGCATGEEAYSVAILLLETLQSQGKTCRLQVFASDIDRDAVQFARVGRYPRSIEGDVSPHRLRRYFQLEDGETHYRVNKTLREVVVFSDQNVMCDPPFSNLDLICCRNVLIYLKPEIQDRIISLFHYSLRHPGYLMLGTAETIGGQQRLFETINKRWRIYGHVGERRPEGGGFPLASQEARRAQETIAMPPRREMRLTRMVQQRLLD
ncbi:MAG: chemotaxis protein CheB, partial [Planctomycetaceae bacterium]